jgi:uncharacterized protein (DUF924 family)
LPTSTTKKLVLQFWFGDPNQSGNQSAINSAALARKRKKIWYRSGPELDQTISEQFSDLLQSAVGGDLDAWRETADGCLALVILLDQFSRHIYRGTSKAFTQDKLALEVVQGMTEHQGLSVLERAFLYHPFEHSESAAMQALSIQHFQSLVDDASAEWKPMMSEFYRHAVKHRDIIETFGRFPHRNAILGRTSTDAEQQFLASGASTFGQKAKSNHDDDS